MKLGIVCIDVVSGIEKTLSEDDRKDITLIEDKISSYCKQKKLSPEQKKIVSAVWSLYCSAITLILSRERFLVLSLSECLQRMCVFVSWTRTIQSFVLWSTVLTSQGQVNHSILPRCVLASWSPILLREARSVWAATRRAVILWSIVHSRLRS